MTCWGRCALFRPFCLRRLNSRATTPALGCWSFWRWICWCSAWQRGCAQRSCLSGRSQGLLRGAVGLLLAQPGRCVAGGVVLMAGVGGMILLFPVSVFWAVLFGFWLPGLAAMQLYFPVLREQYGLTVQQIPRPAPAPQPQTEKEQKRARRANWWYYNWGIVAVLAVVALGVVYAVHGLTTTVDPDCTMALVTAEALPDEAVLRLEQSLTPYAEDRNRDGVTVVEVYNYTWSAHAQRTDMNSQMGGAPPG